jgi:hypothetical protein
MYSCFKQRIILELAASEGRLASGVSYEGIREMMDSILQIALLVFTPGSSLYETFPLKYWQTQRWQAGRW